jgi:hypothetical protein
MVFTTTSYTGSADDLTRLSTKKNVDVDDGLDILGKVMYVAMDILKLHRIKSFWFTSVEHTGKLYSKMTKNRAFNNYMNHLGFQMTTKDPDEEGKIVIKVTRL